MTPLIDLVHDAQRWLDAHGACVMRTRVGAAEHVAVALPTGERAEFDADNSGEFETELVLAVDVLSGGWPLRGR